MSINICCLYSKVQEVNHVVNTLKLTFLHVNQNFITIIMTINYSMSVINFNVFLLQSNLEKTCEYNPCIIYI